MTYIGTALKQYLTHLPGCNKLDSVLCSQPTCLAIHERPCSCGLDLVLDNLSTNLVQVKLLTDKKPRHGVGVSVLLCDGGGGVLLGKRINNTGSGLLSTPGGRLELGEDVLDCARREFKEECGSELCGELKILGFRQHNRFGSHYLMFYVLAKNYRDMIVNTEPHKCEGWSWYDMRYIDPEKCTEPKDILDLALAEATRP